MKEQLLNSIHTLLYNSIYCSDPQSTKWNNIAVNGYEKRIIGFRAEIEFGSVHQEKGRTILRGGWLLSRSKGKRCLDDSIYFTICNRQPNDYLAVYKNLESLQFTKMFFIKYDYHESTKNWDTYESYIPNEKILRPVYRCYIFERGVFKDVTEGELGLSKLLDLYVPKEVRQRSASYKLPYNNSDFINLYMGNLPEDELKQILASRFVFDGILGQGYIKGIPNDIDMIVVKNGKMTLLEIKEKDLAKSTIGFGMDVSRLNDIKEIAQRTGLDYYYVVKQVKSQNNREFVDWWYVDINNFYEATKDQKTVEGGTGMATATTDNHPTVVAPLSVFSKYR